MSSAIPAFTAYSAVIRAQEARESGETGQILVNPAPGQGAREGAGADGIFGPSLPQTRYSGEQRVAHNADAAGNEADDSNEDHDDGASDRTLRPEDFHRHGEEAKKEEDDQAQDNHEASSPTPSEVSFTLEDDEVYHFPGLVENLPPTSAIVFRDADAASNASDAADHGSVGRARVSIRAAARA